MVINKIINILHKDSAITDSKDNETLRHSNNNTPYLLLDNNNKNRVQRLAIRQHMTNRINPMPIALPLGAIVNNIDLNDKKFRKVNETILLNYVQLSNHHNKILIILLIRVSNQ